MSIKKTIITLGFILLAAGALHPKFEVGLNVNYWNISDSSVKDSYGSGVVYTPVMEIKIIKGLFLGVSYDLGYKNTATIGLLNDSSTLSMDGGDIFLTWHFGKRALVPYLKCGGGYYSYRQEIDSDALSVRTVSQSEITWMIGGGVKYYFGKFFYLNADLRYSPFNVDGAGSKTIDIGGFKGGVGIGVRF